MLGATHCAHGEREHKGRRPLELCARVSGKRACPTPPRPAPPPRLPRMLSPRYPAARDQAAAIAAPGTAPGPGPGPGPGTAPVPAPAPAPLALRKVERVPLARFAAVADREGVDFQRRHAAAPMHTIAYSSFHSYVNGQPVQQHQVAQFGAGVLSPYEKTLVVEAGQPAQAPPTPRPLGRIEDSADAVVGPAPTSAGGVRPSRRRTPGVGKPKTAPAPAAAATAHRRHARFEGEPAAFEHVRLFDSANPVQPPRLDSWKVPIKSALKTRLVPRAATRRVPAAHLTPAALKQRLTRTLERRKAGTPRLGTPRAVKRTKPHA
jgi:hypothetical protein